MLRIDKVLAPIDGIPIYGDGSDPALFYAIPQYPRFCTDKDGNPKFKYVKFRTPRPDPKGGNCGGLAVFDVEFSLTDATKANIIEALREQVDSSIRDKVRLGNISWANGTTHLNLENLSGTLVSKVFNPGAPSLYGNNVTPFTVELPELGATLFAEALQGKGGLVQVVYNMNGWVQLPPVSGYGRFHSSKFYEFTQKASEDSGWFQPDSIENDIRERLIASDVIEVHIESGTGIDPKVTDRIRDAVYRTVNDVAMKRLAEQIEGYTGDRSVVDGYESIRRHMSSLKISDFSYEISESTAVLWPFNPQGTLPNITTLVDAKGKPIRWDDHYDEIDGDDPFFRLMGVTVRPNAPFDTSPVHSIDVHLEYDGDKLEVHDCHFDDPDQVDSFVCYRKGDNTKYRYQYTVNYDTVSGTYRSPVMTSSSGQLTIDAADTGVVSVEVVAGNLRWDEITAAAVTLRYAPMSGPAVEDQVVLTKAAPTGKFERVILEQWDQPVAYSVDYQMADGTTYRADGLTTRSRRLFINSPFRDQLTIGVRSAGSFDEIERISLDLTYSEPANHYRQSTQATLDGESTFFDWTFGVIDASVGTVTYSGTIRRVDGTVEDIPETTATGRTIVVGEKLAKLLQVSVVSDLVDWSTVALVKVVGQYIDGDAAHEQRHDFLVKSGAVVPPWTIEIADPAHSTYSWTETYYMKDRTPPRPGASGTSGDSTIVLMGPAS